MPKKAADWVESALEKAESILMTIDDMQRNGKDAPTSNQTEALENIYIACNWLKKKP